MASQTTDTSENDAEVREKIANLQQKISDVKSECSGIKKDLDTIFGFTTATTVASGLGTVAAGGALVAGIKKSKTDKSADEIEQQLSQKKERLAYIDEKLFRAENLSDSEDEIFLTENIKKIYQIEAESRKSRCSTQMKSIKDDIEKAKKTILDEEKFDDKRLWERKKKEDYITIADGISNLASLCGYRKAWSLSYPPVFSLKSIDQGLVSTSNMNIVNYNDDNYISYLEEIEKELDMGLESFDKKYFLGSTNGTGGVNHVSINYSEFDEKARMLYEKKADRRIALYEEQVALWKEKPVLEKEISELEKELEVLNVNSESTGNVRTGLMAGATVTSAVSTGTSIGATVNADKLAKKMSDCNQKLYELKIAKSELEALESSDKSAVEIGENATKILGACTGYNKNNINTVKNKMTASAIISGIGTATGATGTITSAMANSKKVREDDSVKGKKKEKNLNLTANIMAGITTGTSLSTTVISATAIADAKKDSKMAEECEAVLK